MAPRKKNYQTQSVRRSERIRRRKEAAIAARTAELEQLEQELRTERASLRRGLKRLLRRVSAGGGVTRRDRPPRRIRAVTSTPLSEQAETQVLFDRFMERIFHAANESHTGKFTERRPNLNQEEQPNEALRRWVSGQELCAEDDLVELNLTIPMVDSGSDLDLL